MKNLVFLSVSITAMIQACVLFDSGKKRECDLNTGVKQKGFAQGWMFLMFLLKMLNSSLSKSELEVSSNELYVLNPSQIG